jgi:toxin FitB
VNGFLLDTNVISELIRSRPTLQVTEWLNSQNEPSLFLSSITCGEIRKGIALLPSSERRDRLDLWLRQSLVPRFGDRILPITTAIAERWGILDAEAQLAGHPLNTADGLIAATALEHDLTIVTRNVKDFAISSTEVVNPWTLN